MGFKDFIVLVVIGILGIAISFPIFDKIVLFYHSDLFQHLINVFCFDVVNFIENIKAFFVENKNIFYVFIMAIGWAILPLYFVLRILNGAVFTEIWDLIMKLKFESSSNKCDCCYEIKNNYYAKRRFG